MDKKQERKVKYKNELNNISLGDLTTTELNIFITLLNKAKHQGTRKIDLTFKELKEIAGIKKNVTNKELVTLVDNVGKKLFSNDFRLETDEKIIRFVLFTTFIANKKTKLVEISVNPDLEYLLNDFNVSFSFFELEEFIKLDSVYSKEVYRRLKQFRYTGWWKVSIDKFKYLLKIPKSYRSSDINKKVLKPVTEELSPIFSNLEIIKIVDDTKRGHPIKGYEFKFDKETRSNTANTIDNDIEKEALEYANSESEKRLKEFITPNTDKYRRNGRVYSERTNKYYDSFNDLDMDEKKIDIKVYIEDHV